jgi:peptide chain release factor 1
MDLADLVEQNLRRFEELDAEVSSGSLYDNPARARQILREHARLKDIRDLWLQTQSARQSLAESRHMAETEEGELAELARCDVEELDARLGSLSARLQVALLPPEPGEDRDAVVEIRAGTGGEEAALFAADLFRMYVRYAEATGWKVEPLDSSPSGLGGFRQIVFKIAGDAVFRKLRYESGVHRVQRVPATEAQGRIHTSTATVAVMPEAEEVDVEIKPEDLRIEVCRAGGPGGQGVNTTDSAVQVMHIPTGKIVRCQDGRSQMQNKERALQILRTRLLEEKIREEQQKVSAHRRSLIGSGERNEKIRTYNFPQNRVTDHRIELTLHNLDRFLEGDLSSMIEALHTHDVSQRIEQARMAA